MATEQVDHRSAVLAQLAAERRRRDTLGQIVRSILSEQPSPATVRSAARQIDALVWHIADEIAEQLAHRVSDTAS